MRNYTAHILCDDGFEEWLSVQALNADQAAEYGFWEALERCLSPVEVVAVEEVK